MTIEPRKPSEVPVKTGGAALGAFFGWALGSGLRAVVGDPGASEFGGAVGAIAAPLMEEWVARTRKEFARRWNEVAFGVVGASHLDQSETVERLVSSDQLQPLVKRVLDAAERTDSTRKLRLLRAVLGEAVGDRPRKIEDDFLIVAALDDLGPSHVRILETLERVPNPDNSAQRWIASTILATLPDVSELAFHGALGGLFRHGLVQTLNLYGAIGYEFTDLGRAVLDVMRLDLGEPTA